MSNVHPWFANVSIDIAAGWTNEFFQENNVIVAASLPNNPKMYIAETGWPTVCVDAFIRRVSSLLIGCFFFS